MEEWPASHGSMRIVKVPGNVLRALSGAILGEKVKRKVVSALRCLTESDIIATSRDEIHGRRIESSVRRKESTCLGVSKVITTTAFYRLNGEAVKV